MRASCNVGGTRKVHVKDLDSHATKALLVSRALLVKIKRDLENQIRGLLKNLGLVIGRAKMNVFAVRAAELADARPAVAAAVEPLLKAREAVGRQIADLDRKVLRLARNNAQVRRFMTAPGVGPTFHVLAQNAAQMLLVLSSAYFTPSQSQIASLAVRPS